MGENSNSPSDTCVPRNRVNSRLLCTCHSPDRNLSTTPVLPYRILTAASYRRGNRGTERLNDWPKSCRRWCPEVWVERHVFPWPLGWRGITPLQVPPGWGGVTPLQGPARLLTSHLPSLSWPSPPARVPTAHTFISVAGPASCALVPDVPGTLAPPGTRSSGSKCLMIRNCFSLCYLFTVIFLQDG